MRWRSAQASTAIRLTICFLLLPLILQVTLLARPAAGEKPKENRMHIFWEGRTRVLPWCHCLLVLRRRRAVAHPRYLGPPL